MFVDESIMYAIRTEVHNAIQKHLLPLIQTSQNLQEELARLGQAVYSRKEIDYRLDAIKRDLLERIDHVQEICDSDLLSNRRAVNQLKELKKTKPSTQRGTECVFGAEAIATP